MQNQATTIRQEVLMAAAVMTALTMSEQGSKEPPRIEDISLLLFKLKNAGVDLGEIALRRVPGGFYSEDIEALIGHYLAAGYAEQRSPVKLYDKGRQVLSEIIETERKENPSAVQKIEAVLGRLAAQL
jgi:hypothetical protein